ncbi:hypothetical protein [Kitasatospora sp. GAS204B]|uniref:hypothetical protein n=1 Tax=unclassified Kitasatospora TaxID=2633591 RepID=UPI0024759EB6|nr:hypothetical protein [Kitasatospora sp. GAS204B]MDH6119741.1 hypothetical protein [Kitasatospora sp. GAS204B]
MGLASPARRTHDLTAARMHRIVKTCARLRIAVLAYTGAGGTFAVPMRRKPSQETTAGQSSLNRAHTRLRSPDERSVATIKQWQIFRRARCSADKPGVLIGPIT